MSEVAGAPALEVVYLTMSESVRELIKQYQAFCEVAPYYVVFEERSSNGAITKQRIQAGLDIDVYGVKSGLEPGQLSDYALVILDTRRKLPTGRNDSDQDHHGRGIGQPAGEPEEKALNAIVTQLNDLGNQVKQ